MGNIICHFLDQDTDSLNNDLKPSHEQVDELEKEQQDAKNQNEKNNEQNYKENNEEINVNEPDKIDDLPEIPEETKKFELPRNFQEKSDVEFINEIMKNINDFQTKTINNSYTFIKNLYPDLSNKPESELINEFMKIATEDQIIEFENIFEPIVQLSKEQLFYLIEKITAINTDFNNHFTANKTIEKIEKFAHENNLSIDNSIFTPYLNQIQELKNESDQELKTIKDLKIDESVDYLKAVEILKSALDLFMDLTEDQNAINTINLNMENEILVNNLQKQVELNKLKNELSNQLNTLNSSISIDLETINNWDQIFISNKSKLDSYSELVLTNIAELENLSKIEDYADLEINMETYLTAQTEFNKFNEISQKQFAELSPKLNNLKTNFENLNNEISNLSIDGLVTNNVLPNYESKLNELKLLYNDLEIKINELTNNYNAASKPAEFIITEYSEITNSASELLNNLITEYKSNISNGITTIKNNIETIKLTLNSKNLNYENIVNKLDYNKSLSEQISKNIDEILYYNNNIFGKYNDLIVDSEGSTFYKFNVFSNEIKNLFDSATVLELPFVKQKYEEMETFNNTYLNAVKSVNDEINYFNKLVDSTSNLIIEREKEIQKQKDDEKYKQDTSELRSTIQINLTELNKSIDLLNEKNKVVSEFITKTDQLLKHETFTNLSKIESLHPDNPNAKTAQENINLAISLKASLTTYMNEIQSQVSLMTTNINQQISLYVELLNKSDVKNENRISKEELSTSVSNLKASTDELISTSLAISDENRVTNDYNLLVQYINIAYTNAMIIDKQFESYLEFQLSNYQEVIQTYIQILKTFKESSNKYLSLLNNNANVINCWFKQASMICRSDLDVSKIICNSNNETENNSNTDDTDDTDDIYQVYLNQLNRWNEISYMFNDTTEEFKNLQNINTQLENLYVKNIEPAYNSSKTLQSDAILQSQQIDKLISDFETESSKLSKDVTLGIMQEIFNSAQISYTSAQDIVNEIINYQTNLQKLQENSKYTEFKELVVTKTSEIISNAINKYNGNIENAYSYQCAAKIISYLYGHYYIGNNAEKLEIEKYIRNALIPEKINDKLVVFKKLCVFTPILPLIWPNGSSELEIKFQSKTTQELDNERISILNEYISTQLITYLTNAIFNSNNYEVKNIAEANAYDPSSDNEYTSKITYFEKFINESSFCKSDNEFLALCAYYIDFAHYKLELNPKVLPGIHIYHKILVSLSGKQFNKGQISCVPLTYPSPDLKYELYESIIISLNRFFSYCGKITTKQISSKDDIGKPVTYEEWIKITNIQDKLKVFILGGQCINYDDTIYYRKIMNYNEKAGDVECKNGYAPNIYFNIENTKKIELNSSFSDLSSFMTTIKAYYQVYKTSSNTVQFINPTAITNLIFDDAQNDVFDFVNASINNFMKVYSEKSDAEFVCSELIENISSYYGNTNISTSTINGELVSSLTLSTNLDMGKLVYLYIRDALMNWKIHLPFINYSPIKDEIGYIPITKINAVTMNNKDFGNNYIYSIFENISAIK